MESVDSTSDQRTTNRPTPLSCPSCGSSNNIATERRPNGDHICGSCRHKWPNTKMSVPDTNTMRQTYRALSAAEKQNMSDIKDLGRDFHDLVSGMGNSREISLAKTKIEEAVMWAVKHITA